MLPQKPSKAYIKRTKKLEDIVPIMEKYLEKYGLDSSKGGAYAEKYWNEMINVAISDSVRVILPHNLGYMQVLEHAYNGTNRNHKVEFGFVDYSLVWIKHPMFIHHRINQSKEMHARILDKKRSGVNYLKEYVDGDTYVG